MPSVGKTSLAVHNARKVVSGRSFAAGLSRADDVHRAVDDTALASGTTVGLYQR
jgi:hypothetical protein